MIHNNDEAIAQGRDSSLQTNKQDSQRLMVSVQGNTPLVVTFLITCRYNLRRKSKTAQTLCKWQVSEALIIAMCVLLSLSLSWTKPKQWMKQALLTTPPATLPQLKFVVYSEAIHAPNPDDKLPLSDGDFPWTPHRVQQLSLSVLSPTWHSPKRSIQPTSKTEIAAGKTILTTWVLTWVHHADLVSPTGGHPWVDSPKAPPSSPGSHFATIRTSSTVPVSNNSDCMLTSSHKIQMCDEDCWNTL